MRVACSLLQRACPQSKVGVHPSGGIDKPIRAIPGAIPEPEAEAVGIVVDANDDIVSRWENICDQLRPCKCSPPKNPDPDGTILQATEGNVRVGVWLMPDNQASGEIENFVETMVPRRDANWKDAVQYVESRQSPPGKRVPATLRVWLAVRDGPHHMGAAIKRNDLRVDGPRCRAFCAWLKKLPD